MALLKKRRRRKSKKGIFYFIFNLTFYIFYLIFTAIRKSFSSPARLSFLGIFIFCSWFYYSGEYDNFRYKVGEGRDFLYKKAELTLNDILLEGQNNTPKQDILDSIATNNNSHNLYIGQPLANINLTKTKNNLEKLAWVKYAEVDRQYPGTLSIRIVEKIPVALWKNNEEILLLDSDSKEIKTNNIENFLDFIVLIGDDAPSNANNLLEMASTRPKIRDMISSAERIGSRRWDINLKNGIKINLPEKNPEKAWKLISELHEKNQILDSNISQIDLKIADKMYVKK